MTRRSFRSQDHATAWRYPGFGQCRHPGCGRALNSHQTVHLLCSEHFHEQVAEKGMEQVVRDADAYARETGVDAR